MRGTTGRSIVFSERYLKNPHPCTYGMGIARYNNHMPCALCCCAGITDFALFYFFSSVYFREISFTHIARSVLRLSEYKY